MPFSPFKLQMSVEPKLLKDEYTDKYYHEEYAHNKELFNPAKAVMSSSASKSSLGKHSVSF